MGDLVILDRGRIPVPVVTFLVNTINTCNNRTSIQTKYLEFHRMDQERRWESGL